MDNRRVYVNVPFVITDIFREIVPLGGIGMTKRQDIIIDLLIRTCVTIGIPEDAYMYFSEVDHGNKFNRLFFCHKSFEKVLIGDLTPPFSPSIVGGIWNSIFVSRLCGEFDLNSVKISLMPDWNS